MEEGGFAGETRGECQLNWEIVFMDRLEYEISCSEEENAFLNQVGKRVGIIGWEIVGVRNVLRNIR